MASLRDLGLSEYEERAYRALLNTGPTTAKELSRASDVPMGRIYDVLNSLERYNLVRSQTASRPKKYIAVEPDTALDRLLEDKKRELREQADQYEQIVDELGAELETADPVEEEFWTAAVGAEESLDLLLERIAAADDRVVVLAAEPAPAFDVGEVGERVTDALAAALDRGVTVQVLMAPELVAALPRSVGRRYSEELQARPDWTVKTGDVNGDVTLVDDAEVLVQVPNPLDPEEPFAMIDLKDPEFAADAEATFRPAWEDAEELRLE